ncbi:MAG: energy transducer TonB [Acidobacteriota bacterium]|nr:energy transducer TonB [Acidobacteriota bacterium]
MEVFNFDGEDAAAKNAAATATNIKTRRVYRSVLKDAQPYFDRLPEGEYEIILRKAGFKRTKNRYEVACADAEQGVLSHFLYMQPGSPKEIYNSARVKLGAANVNPGASGENLKLSSPIVGQGGGTGVPIKGDVSKWRPGENLSAGVLNANAVSLPKPEYPRAAKAVRAAGVVSIQVTIDEEGNVISAEAVAGHPLLQPAALKAARLAKFPPTLLEGKPVKVTGIIVYYFVAN